MNIKFLTMGGTIDKIYFDASSRFEVGESQLSHILGEGLVTFDFDVVSLTRKDSLDMTADDRKLLADYIKNDAGTRFVVTHGTDTLADSAEALTDIKGKTIVLTGALSPARFRTSDATFNVGMAVAAAQVAAPGVYVAVSGRIFEAGKVVKNRAEQRFEEIS